MRHLLQWKNTNFENKHKAESEVQSINIMRSFAIKINVEKKKNIPKQKRNAQKRKKDFETKKKNEFGKKMYLH